MKHLTLVAAATLALSASVLAQPNPGGPIQLHNPHRGDNGGFGGRGGVLPSLGAGIFSSAEPEFASPAPMQATPPPLVTMVADGRYLFILRGDTLMQFDKKTLRLLNSVELPHPTMPAPGDMAPHTAPSLLLVPDGGGNHSFGF